MCVTEGGVCISGSSGVLPVGMTIHSQTTRLCYQNSLLLYGLYTVMHGNALSIAGVYLGRPLVFVIQNMEVSKAVKYNGNSVRTTNCCLILNNVNH